MKITIKDVAEMAGVSKATVSRVMNNSKPVSDEIRKRVMDAIESTNFKPSAVARSLSNQKTKTIGVIVPDVANPLFSEIIKGIEEVAREAAYTVLLCVSGYEDTREMHYLEVLKEKEVDGLILSSYHNTKEQKQMLLNFGKPVVLVGFEDDDFTSVEIDNHQAAIDVAEHFIKNHKKIGMIHGPLDDLCAGRMRKEGFESALKNAGFKSHFKEGDFKYHTGFEGAISLCKEHQVTALFCANDMMALGAIKGVQSLGLNIPDDVEIIGFDDVYMSSIYQPSLSTVHQPFEMKGRLATKELIKGLNGQNNIEKIVLDYKLVFRETTK